MWYRGLANVPSQGFRIVALVAWGPRRGVCFPPGCLSGPIGGRSGEPLTGLYRSNYRPDVMAITKWRFSFPHCDRRDAHHTEVPSLAVSLSPWFTGQLSPDMEDHNVETHRYCNRGCDDWLVRSDAPAGCNGAKWWCSGAVPVHRDIESIPAHPETRASLVNCLLVAGGSYH